MEADNKGQFLVLDIETGAYELGSDELEALNRAHAQRPGAPLYILRVGYATAAQLGGVGSRPSK